MKASLYPQNTAAGLLSILKAGILKWALWHPVLGSAEAPAGSLWSQLDGATAVQCKFTYYMVDFLQTMRMSWLVNAFHIIGLLWGESTDHKVWVIWEAMMLMWHHFNTLRLRRNGRHFADDIFKYIFLNENVWIPIKISIKFVPKGPINNIPALVQIMAWRRPGDKPLSEPMMVNLTMHICITRPQWVIISHSWCAMRPVRGASYVLLCRVV